MVAFARCLLRGKIAIVTGSNSGIGEGIAYEFIKHGASVTLNGRNSERLKLVEKKCNELNGNNEKVLIVEGDVCQEDIGEKLIKETLKKFGKLDILVNNAGYFLGNTLSADLDLSRLDAMLNIHVRAPFHLTKIAIPHLVETKGNVINISSVAGSRIFGSKGVEYAMAKAAMDHFSRFAAVELGPKNVRINVISPGAIPTPIFEQSEIKPEYIPQLLEKVSKSHALKRLGTVEEVAKVATFLASDEASFVTGVVMPVDGGLILTPSPAFTSKESQ